MLNSNLNAKHLLEKYRQGTCSEEEQLLVEQWYEQFGSGNLNIDEHIVEGHMDEVWARLKKESKKTLVQRIWMPAKIAASVVLILSIGVYFFLKYVRDDQQDAEISFSQVQPGGNKATLTLADGSVISLEEIKAGVIKEMAEVRISKVAGGILTYDIKDSGSSPNNKTQLNVIKTPNGGQYQVRLPDGTRVMLNAASSLKYPAVFTGRQRVVELTGEAYFDVSANRNMPFIVKSTGQQVQVLGTHFNINAYADEGRIVTTLEEGAVRVFGGGGIATIKPGQQTLLHPDKSLMVAEANLKTALAWKNNKMTFKNAGIAEIMRQISRWYNIKVEYQGAIPEDTITGTISRSSDLSSVLKMFESLEIKFSLVQTSKGKKLIIKP
jgi:transmembrane sensor